MKKQPNYEETYKKFDELLIRSDIISREMSKNSAPCIQLDYIDLDKAYEDFENESNSYIMHHYSSSESNSYNKI